ncbi:DUF3108 domain-containing protein [Prosthecomicrobium pneumaticum]|uniref:DUF3108 domain-containing protein n=1 Tax=Prosthecomicrobium pneumaticum TaxID=81895 RepID=A0A7W9CV35_9HYPH|nr:DUF3108 domain-containing protein [Prosthecomicrobium pneumaticum]MBB5752453.1 hypothetical protein [Prosthecomicrobium pneumaticum]
MVNSFLSRTGLGRCVAALAVAAGLAAPSSAGAVESGSVKATYVITINSIVIGRFTLASKFEGDDYDITVSGSTSGVSRLVSDGSGALQSSGRFNGDKPLPTTYVLETNESGRRTSVNMIMKAGTITRLSAEPPLADRPDRVPVTARDKTNILDPLSAFLVSYRKGRETRACNRSIPVFDGWQRFDIKLFYKATRDVRSASEDGYSGPVIVCGARYVPVAGHRPSREAVEYMARNTAMEVWYAPVEELGVMFPYRFQIGTKLGELAMHSSKLRVNPVGDRASVE